MFVCLEINESRILHLHFSSGRSFTKQLFELDVVVVVVVALTRVSQLLLTFPLNLRISIYIFSYTNIYDYHACSHPSAFFLLSVKAI